VYFNILMYNISTITLTTQLPNCELNLFNVGKFLEIDEDILGIKYNNGAFNILKGSYLTTVYKKAKIKKKTKINTTLFYNQISLIVKYNTSNINVKMFGNGCLHMTGCKDPNYGIEITKIIYSKLIVLKNMTKQVLLVKDINGALLDKDNLFYTHTNSQIIGYYNKEKDVYCIHKKEYHYDSVSNYLIYSKLESKRSRHFIDFDGNQIGTAVIRTIKNKNKFFKNNNIYYEPETGLIYHNNEKIIGSIEYQIKSDYKDVHQEKGKYTPKDIVIIDYLCNPFNKDYCLSYFDKQTIDLNINCINIYFKLDTSINRQRLYDVFINKDFICKYKPETYSGIKLVYKFPINKELTGGQCKCSCKCTCLDIVFLIFQSGNIIATGFKTTENIKPILLDFMNIINPFLDVFKKRIIY
jgi:TATA-box binding protein (TBP) (component of TFIID and TFIIIB)